MKVTIVGAGMMGRGIGTRMVSGGNDVELIDQDAEAAGRLASELAGLERASATAPSGGQIGGEVVVLAVPYGARSAAVAGLGDQLADKVVVDICNPVDFESMDRLLTPPELSAAEELAAELGDRAPVVKAFNTTFATTLVDGEVNGQRLEVLIAGDDVGANERVVKLVEAGDLIPIDVGPLRRARELEHLGFLHMALQERRDWGFRSAVVFLR